MKKIFANPARAKTQQQNNNEVGVVQNTLDPSASFQLKQHIMDSLMRLEETYMEELTILHDFGKKFTAKFPNSTLSDLLKLVLPLLEASRIFYRSFLNAHQSLTDLSSATLLPDMYAFEHFEKYRSYLTVYILFTNIQSLPDYHEISSTILEFEESQSRYDLDGFLFRPAQRLTAYVESICNLYDYTRTDHPDFSPLSVTLKKMLDRISNIQEHIGMVHEAAPHNTKSISLLGKRHLEGRIRSASSATKRQILKSEGGGEKGEGEKGGESEEVTCHFHLPFDGGRFQDFGSDIATNWGPNLLCKNEVNLWKQPKSSVPYSLNLIEDIYKEQFYNEPHYNFVGTPKTHKRFVLVSVLKTPENGNFRALRHTDNVCFYLQPNSFSFFT
eukprot:TRINITY_DN1711_c0_g2_i2.p1 TRINITY_DN1711_c0_g2~~TRINITY_DN1711_c0_g2_i2.p1  ORF type:complete len:428 (+),score=99.08 TRINITY_DN1711_c0_g2_i2:127-1284(+)